MPVSTDDNASRVCPKSDRSATMKGHTSFAGTTLSTLKTWYPWAIRSRRHARPALPLPPVTPTFLIRLFMMLLSPNFGIVPSLQGQRRHEPRNSRPPHRPSSRGPISIHPLDKAVARIPGGEEAQL